MSAWAFDILKIQLIGMMVMMMNKNEKQLWIAAYSAELSNRLKGVPDLLDETFRDFIKKQAFESARFAAVALEVATELESQYAKAALSGD